MAQKYSRLFSINCYNIHFAGQTGNLSILLFILSYMTRLTILRWDFRLRRRYYFCLSISLYQLSDVTLGKVKDITFYPVNAPIPAATGLVV